MSDDDRMLFGVLSYLRTPSSSHQVGLIICEVTFLSNLWSHRSRVSSRKMPFKRDWGVWSEWNWKTAEKFPLSHGKWRENKGRKKLSPRTLPLIIKVKKKLERQEDEEDSLHCSIDVYYEAIFRWPRNGSFIEFLLAFGEKWSEHVKVWDEIGFTRGKFCKVVSPVTAVMWVDVSGEDGIYRTCLIDDCRSFGWNWI